MAFFNGLKISPRSGGEPENGTAPFEAEKKNMPFIHSEDHMGET